MDEFRTSITHSARNIGPRLLWILVSTALLTGLAACSERRPGHYIVFANHSVMGSVEISDSKKLPTLHTTLAKPKLVDGKFSKHLVQPVEVDCKAHRLKVQRSSIVDSAGSEIAGIEGENSWSSPKSGSLEGKAIEFVCGRNLENPDADNYEDLSLIYAVKVKGSNE